jgi:uncharacterized protein (DUF924 family)
VTDRAREVREFWLGRPPQSARALQERSRVWFGSESQESRRQLDETIRARFGTLVAQASRGELAAWAASPRRRLALILLLDQFSRNIHRGAPEAFANDTQALGLCLTGIQSGADAALNCIERLFFYMPLQHAESREVQDESVAAYRRLLAEAPSALHPLLQDALAAAHGHRELIERFGRFPHRNEILGRASSAEEARFLAQGGERFGQ